MAVSVLVFDEPLVVFLLPVVGADGLDLMRVSGPVDGDAAAFSHTVHGVQIPEVSVGDTVALVPVVVYVVQCVLDPDIVIRHVAEGELTDTGAGAPDVGTAGSAVSKTAVGVLTVKGPDEQLAFDKCLRRQQPVELGSFHTDGRPLCHRVVAVTIVSIIPPTSAAAIIVLSEGQPVDGIHDDVMVRFADNSRRSGGGRAIRRIAGDNSHDGDADLITRPGAVGERDTYAVAIGVGITVELY